MRIGIVVVLALVLGGCVAGCAALDSFFGVSEDGSSKPGESPSDMVGSLLGLVLPGAGGLAGVARWAYVEFRRRRLAGAFKAAVAGVTSAVDAAKGNPVDKASLYGALTAASDVYANRDFFATAVAKIKEEVRTAKK